MRQHAERQGTAQHPAAQQIRADADYPPARAPCHGCGYDRNLPTCFGKGKIKSSILFTDTLENKIDYLVNKLKVKKFSLHVHPYVAAYINQGIMSLKRKWQMKYGFGIKIIPNQKLAFLQYVFYDTQREEIDMKEEIEIK